jgi:hypothetical protein
MASLEGDWYSNPLRVVALMKDVPPEERAEACVMHHLSHTDVVWVLMRQNQLMQDENRLLRKKMQALQEENVWASTELDRMHWEHQTALVEIKWLWNQRLASWNLSAPPNDCATKTYAEMLQAEEQQRSKVDGCERCVRHEPTSRREKRQCKCCVLEAISKLVLSAPRDVQDMGEFVAAGLVKVPPFVNFWCPECTKDFVNQTSRSELEAILQLVGRIEHGGSTMQELKQHMKHKTIRQRVKCALHAKP